MKHIQFWPLIVCIIICQSAGIIGSVFTVSSVKTWYTTIKKPSFNPPSWVFSPVWITLFLLMGISLYLVWTQRNSSVYAKTALMIFAVQLILNIFWSVLFFGMRAPFYAFVEIIVLWMSIAAMIVCFYRVNSLAGILQIPYLLWVSFAAVLNFFLYRLNM